MRMISHDCNRCNTQYWSLGICICNEALSFHPNNSQIHSFAVEMWIKYEVKLPQYYQILIDNGFDQMVFISEIEEWHLRHIGLISKEHIAFW